MADPATMTMIAMGSSALSGVTKAAGALLGGASQSSMYKYQSGVAQVNQQIAKENAGYTRYMGEFEAQRSGIKAAQDIGNTRVLQSGRGLDITSGSAAGVTDSQAALAAQDQAVIRSSAARRAYGFDIEAEKQRTQQSVYNKAAQRSKLASYIEAGGSLLGAASSVSGKWMDASRLGMMGGGSGGVYTGASPDFPFADE